MPASDRIKTQRAAARLSQEEVAERMRPYWPNISKGTVSKTENDGRPILLDEAPLWAKALECAVTDLVDPLPDSPKPLMPRRNPKRKRKQ